jgi:hypothetical protein
MQAPPTMGGDTPTSVSVPRMQSEVGEEIMYAKFGTVSAAMTRSIKNFLLSKLEQIRKVQIRIVINNRQKYGAGLKDDFSKGWDSGSILLVSNRMLVFLLY